MLLYTFFTSFFLSFVTLNFLIRKFKETKNKKNDVKKHKVTSFFWSFMLLHTFLHHFSYLLWSFVALKFFTSFFCSFVLLFTFLHHFSAVLLLHSFLHHLFFVFCYFKIFCSGFMLSLLLSCLNLTHFPDFLPTLNILPLI